MKIALYSRVFSPSIGGLENMARLLAEQFAAVGHEVIVATQTVESASDGQPFPVVRQPNPLTWARIVQRSDVTLHMNLSLKAVWADLFVGGPTVVSHHGCYPGKRLRDRLRMRTMKVFTNIAASEAVASRLAVPAVVIPDCYDDRVFTRSNHHPRNGVAFVGRLVSDKGVDVLFRALALLAAEGPAARLSIIGEGPERGRLEELANDLGLSGNVEFLGALAPPAIAETLNRHEVVVIPSRVEEGFGMVALEAIACGCVVVGSLGGGLPEAIGPCGVTFSSGDPRALARELGTVLSDEALRRRLRGPAEGHLRSHTRAVIASKYLDVMSSVV